jgi:protein gp37
MCKGGNFPCYAYKLAHRRLKGRYVDNPNIALQEALNGVDLHSEDVDKQLHDPFYPRFWEDRIEEPLHKKRPAGIFVCSMGELFGDWIPPEWQDKVFQVIRARPEHRFYLLTKQPQNLIKFSPFPDNCWVGVTVAGKTQAYSAYDGLKGIQAKVRFVSLEPLLEKLDPWGLSHLNTIWDWVIIGAQTKPYKSPKIELVQEIVEVCEKTRVPVFLKENLIPIMPQNTFDSPFHFGIHGLRQEMPT